MRAAPRLESIKPISASAVKVKLGEPVVVSMADPAEQTWGYFQFPTISRMPGGEILLTYNNTQDDDLCYGHAGPAFVSRDDGRSWQIADLDEKALTISHSPIAEVFNGEYLCVPMPVGFRVSELPKKALLHLGRRAEALEAIRLAFEVDPENADTHVTQGLAALHAGDHERARELFREALRIEPHSIWAQHGLVEAMQFEYPVYRYAIQAWLGFALWFSRFGQWARLALIATALFLLVVMAGIVQMVGYFFPTLWPWLNGGLLFFVLVILFPPIAHAAVVRFGHEFPTGRTALSETQKWLLNAVIGITFFVPFAVATAHLAQYDRLVDRVVAFSWPSMLLVAFTCAEPPGPRKTKFAWFTLAVAIAGPLLAWFAINHLRGWSAPLSALWFLATILPVVVAEAKRFHRG